MVQTQRGLRCPYNCAAGVVPVPLFQRPQQRVQLLPFNYGLLSAVSLLQQQAARSPSPAASSEPEVRISTQTLSDEFLFYRRDLIVDISIGRVSNCIAKLRRVAATHYFHEIGSSAVVPLA